MSEKLEETKEASAKNEEKPEETQKAAAKAEKKSAETQQKAAKVEKESPKAQEEPAKGKKKPLEKMTVKELREMAKEIPGITGVHGMKKDELIVEIKKAKGIKDEPEKKAHDSIAELKQKIKALKEERRVALEAKDKKKATIYKRRISRLKKKTRRVAA